jgi:hypothetical protein
MTYHVGNPTLIGAKIQDKKRQGFLQNTRHKAQDKITITRQDTNKITRQDALHSQDKDTNPIIRQDTITRQRHNHNHKTQITRQDTITITITIITRQDKTSKVRRRQDTQKRNDQARPRSLCPVFSPLKVPSSFSGKGFKLTLSVLTKSAKVITAPTNEAGVGGRVRLGFGCGFRFGGFGGLGVWRFLGSGWGRQPVLRVQNIYRISITRTCQTKTEQSKTRQGETTARQDKTRQDKTRQDKHKT